MVETPQEFLHSKMSGSPPGNWVPLITGWRIFMLHLSVKPQQSMKLSSATTGTSPLTLTTLLLCEFYVVTVNFLDPGRQ